MRRQKVSRFTLVLFVLVMALVYAVTRPKAAPEPAVTPAPVNAELKTALGQVDGVRSIDLLSVLDTVVSVQATVERGADLGQVATAMMDAAGKALVSAALEFSVILNDGAQAADYTWDNAADEWQVTPIDPAV